VACRGEGRGHLQHVVLAQRDVMQHLPQHEALTDWAQWTSPGAHARYGSGCGARRGRGGAVRGGAGRGGAGRGGTTSVELHCL
jgi:hypothetical protein